MGMKSPFRSVSRQKVKKSVKTIWTYSRQLFSVSGVNGVSHVALAKTNGRRALWIIIFAIAVTGWFYQTTTLLEYYYKYPTRVKIEVERESVMAFPGLTICNVNKIRRSQYCQEKPEDCASPKSRNRKNNKTMIELNKDESFMLTYEYMKAGKKTLLGHQIEDIIVSCEFSGYPKLDTQDCIEHFTYLYDPHFGNCINLASKAEESLIVKAGDGLGDIEEMRIILNVEHDEYLNSEKDYPGLIVTIHEDNTYPQILAHGMHVYADHSYSFAIEKVTTHLLPNPYKTNCTDYHKLPFVPLSKLEPTPRICTIECLMFYQHEKCGHGYVGDHVVLFSEEMPYDPNQVTENDRECADRLEKDFMEYCTSLCGVPCHDVHFQMNIDSSPTSDHKLVINDTLVDEYKSRTNKTETNMVDVKIHFQSMEHKIFRHSPEYTTEELFSYLGGITGGWLGISLLEFCAFVEGMFSIFIFSFRYCKPKSRSKKKKGRRTPRKIVPLYSQPDQHCECHCRQDYGSLLLALPVAPDSEDSPRTVQVIPFGYY